MVSLQLKTKAQPKSRSIDNYPISLNLPHSRCLIILFKILFMDLSCILQLGAVVGFVVTIAGMLITGSTYEGGLNDFFINTSQSYSLLVAMLCGIIVSGSVSCSVSLCTHTIKTTEDVEDEWAKTISIDNPINPFRLIYEVELSVGKIDTIITVKTMDTIFKRAKIYAVVGCICSIVLFLVILPAVALRYGVLDFETFSTWFRVFQIYSFVCTVIVIVFPPVEEGIQIIRRIRKNKAKSQSSTRL